MHLLHRRVTLRSACTQVNKQLLPATALAALTFCTHDSIICIFYQLLTSATRNRHMLCNTLFHVLLFKNNPFLQAGAIELQVKVLLHQKFDGVRQSLRGRNQKIIFSGSKSCKREASCYMVYQ